MRNVRQHPTAHDHRALMAALTAGLSLLLTLLASRALG